LLKSLILGLVSTFLFSFYLSDVTIIKKIDLSVLDALTARHSQLTSLSHKRLADDIAIVVVDKESLRTTNIKWPWPRALIARLITEICKSHPKVLCIDFLVNGEDPNTDDDLSLIEALRNNKNILLGSFIGSDGVQLTPAEKIISVTGTRYGFTNKPTDEDGACRRARPFIRSFSGDILDYSLSLKTAADFLDIQPQRLIDNVPLLENNTVNMIYTARPGTLTEIPAWKVLAGTADMSKLSNKIVIFGASAELLRDDHMTPLGKMSGIYMIANEIIAYRAKLFISGQRHLFNYCVILMLAFIASAVGYLCSFRVNMLICLLEITSYILLGFFLISRGIMIDYLGGSLAIVFVSLVTNGLKSANLFLENIVLRRNAEKDGLTQLYVYKYFENALRAGLQRSRSSGKRLGLIIYDIDNFKNINDTYGHNFGNELLKSVAKILSRNTRQSDIVARYGGEEFCVLLQDFKGVSVFDHAERIRDQIKDLRLFDPVSGRSVGVTASAGIVTTSDLTSREYEDFFRAADMALYQAKTTGRNKTCRFGSVTD